jgi:hypothetical protein
MTTDKPRRRDLLPACVLEDAPDRLRETEATFAASLDGLDRARDAARKAREAADAAPDADARAYLEAWRRQAAEADRPRRGDGEGHRGEGRGPGDARCDCRPQRTRPGESRPTATS